MCHQEQTGESKCQREYKNSLTDTIYIYIELVRPRKGDVKARMDARLGNETDNVG